MGSQDEDRGEEARFKANAGIGCEPEGERIMVLPEQSSPRDGG